MHTSPTLFVLSSVLVVASLAASASAGTWKPLFNGRDLTGWKPVNVAPSTFTVRDHMIVSTGVPTGVMRTDRMYENYFLELDWRHMKKGGNAGVFVWADAITSPGVPFARAIEVGHRRRRSERPLDGPRRPLLDSRGQVHSGSSSSAGMGALPPKRAARKARGAVEPLSRGVSRWTLNPCGQREGGVGSFESVAAERLHLPGI